MDIFFAQNRVLQSTNCNTEILVILNDIRQTQIILAYLSMIFIALILLISVCCCVTKVAKKIDEENDVIKRIIQRNPLLFRNLDDIPVATVAPVTLVSQESVRINVNN